MVANTCRVDARTVTLAGGRFADRRTSLSSYYRQFRILDFTFLFINKWKRDYFRHSYFFPTNHWPLASF